jgi:hypothetical protein
MAVISRMQGDLLTRIYAALTQDGAARDLTGNTVRIYIQNNNGDLVVDGSLATIDNAASGYVSWDPDEGEMVSGYTWAALVGRCPTWFRVFSGSERDTHPVGEKQLTLAIYPGPS